MRVFLSFALLIGVMNASFAINDYVVDHPNCRIGYFVAEKNKFSALFDGLITELKQRGYTPFPLPQENKVIPSTYYLHFDSSMVGSGLYKDCYVKIIVKQAKQNFPSSKDPVLMNDNGKRKYPRITFDGTYRCQKAIGDRLVHLPYCRQQTTATKP